MQTIGIDIGSREVKLIVLEDGHRVIWRHQLSTASFYRQYCQRVLREEQSFDGSEPQSKPSPELSLSVDFKKLGLYQYIRQDMPLIGMSTGYGRHHTKLNGLKAINEIKAHAYGAMSQSGLKDFVLLDVGGQDVKILKVEKGIVVDLNLNDKCAASCGRYLENMAAALEMDLTALSAHHLDPVTLNSTCAVFSESELVGKMAMGYSVPELAAGVNFALYKRIEPLLRPFRNSPILLSGGVAKNKALVHYLGAHFPAVEVLADAQFNGAIGCAVRA